MIIKEKTAPPPTEAPIWKAFHMCFILANSSEDEKDISGVNISTLWQDRNFLLFHKGGASFFAMFKGGPEKIGDSLSQIEGPLLVKNDISLNQKNNTLEKIWIIL